MGIVGGVVNIARSAFLGYILSVSPDGQMLAYVALGDTTTRLHLRTAQDSILDLPLTDGAYSPFFSPDGQWIGFFTGNQLKKIRVSGGPPIPVAQNIVHPEGAAWADDGRILVFDRIE